MLDLTDFLLARITEDEEAAKGCGVDPRDDRPAAWAYTRGTLAMVDPFGDHQPDGFLYRTWQGEPTKDGDATIVTYWEEDGQHIARWDPARVLAECETKRAIIDMYQEHDHSAHAQHHWSGFDGGYATATDHALGLLAQVYADHPDFDESWRVE